MTFFHLENLRFSRVLRTRDRLVRSGRHFIHSLASASVFQVEEPPEGVEEAVRGAGVALVSQACQR